MGQDVFLSLMKQALMTVLMLSAPALGVAIIVGLSVGLCVLLSYALVLWAMQLGSIAEAAALREVSVILVVLFGMRYLKEPFGRPRLIACGLVLIGMLVMKL